MNEYLVDGRCSYTNSLIKVKDLWLSYTLSAGALRMGELAILMKLSNAHAQLLANTREERKHDGPQTTQ